MIASNPVIPFALIVRRLGTRGMPGDDAEPSIVVFFPGRERASDGSRVGDGGLLRGGEGGVEPEDGFPYINRINAGEPEYIHVHPSSSFRALNYRGVR